jgi:hypothetical protein
VTTRPGELVAARANGREQNKTRPKEANAVALRCGLLDKSTTGLAIVGSCSSCVTSEKGSGALEAWPGLSAGK